MSDEEDLGRQVNEAITEQHKANLYKAIFEDPIPWWIRVISWCEHHLMFWRKK